MALSLFLVKFNDRYQIASVNLDPQDKQWHPFSVDILRKYTKRVMRQLLTILTELHARDLAHRFICPESIKWRWNAKGKPDISLSNLFLIETQNIGGLLPDGAEKAPFTGPYFPPEHFTGDNGVSTAADIYSAGVIFAELLLNDLPDTVIFRSFGRTFPSASVTNDPKWHEVDPKARRLLKNMFSIPVLRKTADKLLESRYFR